MRVLHPDYGWHEITLTTPTDSEWPSIGTIRWDVIRMLQAIRAVMRAIGGSGTAAHWEIEISSGGVIHAHALFFGRAPDQRRVLEAARRYIRSLTRIQIDPLATDAEVVRWSGYITKGIVPRWKRCSPRVQDGDDPGLCRTITRDEEMPVGDLALTASQAADLVVALRGLRRRVSYGWLRDVPVAQVAADDLAATFGGGDGVGAVAAEAVSEATGETAQPDELPRSSVTCPTCGGTEWVLHVVGAVALGGAGEHVPTEDDPTPRPPPEWWTGGTVRCQVVDLDGRPLGIEAEPTALYPPPTPLYLSRQLVPIAWPWGGGVDLAAKRCDPKSAILARLRARPGEVVTLAELMEVGGWRRSRVLSVVQDLCKAGAPITAAIGYGEVAFVWGDRRAEEMP